MDLEVLSIDLRGYSPDTNAHRIMCSGVGLRLILNEMGAYELKPCCSGYEFKLIAGDIACTQCGRGPIGGEALCMKKFASETDWVEEHLSARNFDPLAAAYHAHTLVADFYTIWAAMDHSLNLL